MVDQPPKTIEELAKHVGRFREEAFYFVREGLSHTAEQVHGPETEAHRQLHQFLASQNMDWQDLIELHHTNQLPPPVEEAIEAAGGWEKLDRHVTGRQLCWGLRDYALQRWGMLARTVLESWNVKDTRDFGRIVFGFIECNLMQQQPGDSIADFEDIYSFEEAFDEPFRPLLPDGPSDGNGK